MCAPVWRRIMQQALEYMHVPHDLDVKTDPRRQALTASARQADIDESSDHLGTPLVMSDDANTAASDAKNTPPSPPPTDGTKTAKVVDTSARDNEAAANPPAPADTLPSETTATTQQPSTGGTVIVDVSSGPVVPSFVGKTMRGAVETAQQTGLEISVVGTGIARQQFPSPGNRLPAGQRVMVRFSR